MLLRLEMCQYDESLELKTYLLPGLVLRFFKCKMSEDVYAK